MNKIQTEAELVNEMFRILIGYFKHPSTCSINCEGQCRYHLQERTFIKRCAVGEFLHQRGFDTQLIRNLSEGSMSDTMRGILGESVAFWYHGVIETFIRNCQRVHDGIAAKDNPLYTVKAAIDSARDIAKKGIDEELVNELMSYAK